MSSRASTLLNGILLECPEHRTQKAVLNTDSVCLKCPVPGRLCPDDRTEKRLVDRREDTQTHSCLLLPTSLCRGCDEVGPKCREVEHLPLPLHRSEPSFLGCREHPFILCSLLKSEWKFKILISSFCSAI